MSIAITEKVYVCPICGKVYDETGKLITVATGLDSAKRLYGALPKPCKECE